MNNSEKLADLRHFLANWDLAPQRPPIPLGAPDTVLGGGLRRGALHEVFAEDWSAGGFAACLGLLAAGHTDRSRKCRHPLFWVRPDYEALEYGALSATGFHELGGDPETLYQLRAPGAAGALAAAADILSCPHVGAVVIELSGRPGCLDLVASRRLALLAAESGITVLLLRSGAEPMPSAAATRWQVGSAPSPPSDDDWGTPRFAARLTRHRLGGLAAFTLKWDCDHGIFRNATSQPAQDHGTVAAAAFDRPARARVR